MSYSKSFSPLAIPNLLSDLLLSANFHYDRAKAPWRVRQRAATNWLTCHCCKTRNVCPKKNSNKEKAMSITLFKTWEAAGSAELSNRDADSNDSQPQTRFNGLASFFLWNSGQPHCCLCQVISSREALWKHRLLNKLRLPKNFNQNVLNHHDETWALNCALSVSKLITQTRLRSHDVALQGIR